MIDSANVPRIHECARIMQACLNSTSICIGYYATATANCHHQIINLTNSSTISSSQFGASNPNSGSTGDSNSKCANLNNNSSNSCKTDRMTGIFSQQQQNSSSVPSSSSATTVTTVNCHKMTGIRRTVSSATPSSIGCVSGRVPSAANNVGCLLSSKTSGGTTIAQQARINAAANANHHSNCKETHKKLDRSFSEPAEKKNLTSSASSGSLGPSSRYKTELCRSFAEVGSCKYGDKCQFAHGEEELRTVNRHPKFKTENCKSFHSTGFCPYGPRCHFIHNDESKKTITMSNMQSSSNNGPSTPTINQRMFENSMPGNLLSGSGSNQSHGQTNMSSGAQTSPFATSSPTSVLSSNNTSNSNNNPNLVRPKALSLGSYSLGSSGEVSSPSSQSGSPTSLNSFFTEDMAFHVHGVPFGSSNGSSSRMCPSYQPTSTFSFSPDSAFDSFSATNCANSGGVSSMSFSSGNGSQKCVFGGSQPTLSSGEFSSQDSANAGETNFISSFFCGLPSNSDFMTRPMSPMGGKSSSSSSHPMSSAHQMIYPTAPDSPVDSVTSEIEALKLGEMQPSTFSPISSSFCVSSLSSGSAGSPPTSGIADQLTSYLSSNSSTGGALNNNNHNSNITNSNIPQRLPTFTRFATNGTSHHGNSIELVE